MAKKFTVINESFTCENCGSENFPAKKTCRNHCTECLHSKHLDIFPGDRAANCGGMLTPTGVEFKGGEIKSILFKCQKCNHKGKNKVAIDDNRDRLLELINNF